MMTLRHLCHQPRSEEGDQVMQRVIRAKRRKARHSHPRRSSMVANPRRLRVQVRRGNEKIPRMKMSMKMVSKWLERLYQPQRRGEVSSLCSWAGIDNPNSTAVPPGQISENTL